MNTNNRTDEMAEALASLFQSYTGSAPEAIHAMPVSGSNRKYFRLEGGGKTLIGTYNTDQEENCSFRYFSKVFLDHGLRVPQVLAVSDDNNAYLQEDLGGRTLFSVLQEQGFSEELFALYREAVQQLARFQWLAGKDSDYTQCHAARRFDKKMVLADLLYFKYYFADLQQIKYDRARLAEELEALSAEADLLSVETLMYRDFQSRNILVQDGRLSFIDFQGAMEGPPQYDLASFLWQARAQLPSDWKSDLFSHYVEYVDRELDIDIDRAQFARDYQYILLLRMLQVLGAYGYRGLIERKEHFIDSIPPALHNLEDFLGRYPQVLASYPELEQLLRALTDPKVKEKYSPKIAAGVTPALQVSVRSFSYKNGIPKEEAGHGGGYVFDCRGLLNPGRYDEYKCLSGKDQTVKDFLEQRTEMPNFLQHAYALVSLNVEDYLARGFEHLSVNFGCTGGQHRSVYAAEHMAAFLKKKYGIVTAVEHLNTMNWKTTMAGSEL